MNRLQLAAAGMITLIGGSALADDLLLAVIEFDGLPAGIRMLDPSTGAVIDDFVPADFQNNGMLWPVEAIAPGPNRTVLLGQPGGDGVISQYDEDGNYLGVYLGGIPDPNAVDNIRSMVVSNDGRSLYTADWDDTNDIHRFNLADGAPDGLSGDPLGTLIFGSQASPDLGQPQAVEMLADGDLLVGDLTTGRLMLYNAETGARIGEFTAMSFVGSIQDLDQQPDGSVVSTESGSGNRVRRFSNEGTPIGGFGFASPDGVHMLPNGDYLVGSGSSFGQGKGLFRVSPDGAILEVIDSTRSYGAIELVKLLDPECAADLNGDGSLNFFDISAFLTLFADNDLAVDFTDDGEINFFDVSAYLSMFGVGCP